MSLRLLDSRLKRMIFLLLSLVTIASLIPNIFSTLRSFLLFNLGYRKLEKLTEFISRLGMIEKTGLLSRKLSYGIG